MAKTYLFPIDLYEYHMLAEHLPMAIHVAGLSLKEVNLVPLFRSESVVAVGRLWVSLEANVSAERNNQK